MYLIYELQNPLHFSFLYLQRTLFQILPNILRLFSRSRRVNRWWWTTNASSSVLYPDSLRFTCETQALHKLICINLLLRISVRDTPYTQDQYQTFPRTPNNWLRKWDDASQGFSDLIQCGATRKPYLDLNVEPVNAYYMARDKDKVV